MTDPHMYFVTDRDLLFTDENNDDLNKRSSHGDKTHGLMIWGQTDPWSPALKRSGILPDLWLHLRLGLKGQNGKS